MSCLQGFGRFAESEEDEVAEVGRSFGKLQTAEESAAQTVWGPHIPDAVKVEVDFCSES